jgi:HD-GYP domain-containing protein (c-di-GMP phosphodiesterase class II)
MRFARLSHLRPGDRLGRDVSLDPSMAPLLRQGVRLSAPLIRALAQHGVEWVWVDDDLSRGIQPEQTLTEATRAMASRAINETLDEASEAFKRGEGMSETALDGLKQIAERIAGEIAGSPEATLALADLASADAYTMKHSLGVTTIGLLIGTRFLNRHGYKNGRGETMWRGIDAQIVKLGTGLLLHDVGKLAIPAEIIHKPGRLTPEEFEVVKTHPLVGWNMLKDSRSISLLSTAVVRSHHERWDGSGYPDRKVEQRIPLFARIAAVADVYDAVTSTRSYREARSAAEAYAVIMAGAGVQFDPLVVDMFRRCVAPYPEGETVLLSDGTRGVVAALPKGELERPLVRVVVGPDGRRIPPREVALVDRPDLRVVQSGVLLEPHPAADAKRRAA